MNRDLVESGVPEHLHRGLVLYIKHHVEPGGFLVAVLSNDLKEAMGRADDNSRAGLFNLVSFLYNYAPSTCWGSPARVAGWLSQRSVSNDEAATGEGRY